MAVGLGASYRIETSSPRVAFVPYIGIICSRSKFDLGNTPFRDGDFFVLRNLQSDKLWGYAVGITFTLNDMIGVTAEGHWGNEQALYINGQFSF